MEYIEILREYEKLREKKKNELEDRIDALYHSNEDVSKIEKEISKLDQERIFYIFSNATIVEKDNKNREIDYKIKKLEEKKKKLIDSLIKKGDIPENYFKIEYKCNKCKDTGFIKENGKNKKCKCLIQKILNENYNKANIKKLKEENFKKFSLEYYSNEIKDGINGVSPRENIKNILKDVKLFIRDFSEENRKIKNFFFTGKTGLGKTFLSNAIAVEILKKGYTVFYQTSDILFNTLIQKKFNDFYEYNNTIKELIDVDLLIIDDFGTELRTDAKNAEVFSILNQRLLLDKSTIISTNVGIEDIKKYYEERIFSRIIGNFSIKRFFGEDIRKIKMIERKNKEREIK